MENNDKLNLTSSSLSLSESDDLAKSSEDELSSSEVFKTPTTPVKEQRRARQSFLTPASSTPSKFNTFTGNRGVKLSDSESEDTGKSDSEYDNVHVPLADSFTLSLSDSEEEVATTKRSSKRHKPDTDSSSISYSDKQGGGNNDKFDLSISDSDDVTKTDSEDEINLPSTSKSANSLLPGYSSPSPSTSSSKGSKKLKAASGIKTERELCAEMGIDFDDLAHLDIGDRVEEEKYHVDNIIDDILSKGLGRSKKKKKQSKEDQEREQYNKMMKHVPISFTSNGRLAVLKEDIDTLQKTKDSIDALVKVLEKTRDRLINQDPVKFSQPPSKPRKSPSSMPNP